jgi:transcriptional regulator with XRE-family HTH domain
MSYNKLPETTLVELRVAMLRAGIKQCDIARLADVSPSYVSHFFAGFRHSPQVLEAISKLLPTFYHQHIASQLVYSEDEPCQVENSGSNVGTSRTRGDE